MYCQEKLKGNTRTTRSICFGRKTFSGKIFSVENSLWIIMYFPVFGCNLKNTKRKTRNGLISISGAAPESADCGDCPAAAGKRARKKSS